MHCALEKAVTINHDTTGYACFNLELRFPDFAFIPIYESMTIEPFYQIH